jgi:long-chain fatty acid transport protein
VPRPWIACLLSVLVARVAAADGFLRDGLGPIPAGRGATNVAHADNGSVLLDNPAALADVAPAALADVHVGQYLFAFRYADAENAGVAGQGSLLPIADAALLLRPATDQRLGYGFGVFVPAGFGAEYDLAPPPPFATDRARYRSFAAFVKVVGGVAYRANDRLRLGMHLGLAGAHVRLRMPYFVQSGALAGAPVRVRIDGTGVAPAWALGAQYDVAPRTVVGASYTAPSDFDAGIAGRAEVALGAARDRYDASIAIGLPRAVAVGLRHDAGTWGRVSAETTWRDWSAAFDQVRFDLRRGSGALGVRQVTDRVDLGWRDTWTLGLGVELLATADHTVRLGYTYHPSPAPDATLTPVIPVTLEHVVAAGLGWRIGDARVDLSYQYTFGPTREVGASALVGGDFADSRLAVDGHAWLLGLSWHARP